MVPEDAPATVVDVLANDTDKDSSTLTFVGYVNATHGTVTLTSGVLSYAPESHYSGSDAFTVTVSDGTSTSSATVAVTVTPVADAPIAADDGYVVQAGSTVVGNVLLNDSDEDDDPLSVVASDQQVVAADGSFSYTATTAGVVEFAYTVSDGGLQDTAVLTITVTTQPVTTSELYLRDAGATGGRLTTIAGSDPPTDWDLDTLPGRTIRSSGMKPDETDPAKLFHWDLTVPTGGLRLAGPVDLRLTSSTEGKASKDLDYSAWLYTCAGDGTGCTLLTSTVDVHVDDWSSTAGGAGVQPLRPLAAARRDHPSALLLTTGG